MKREYPKDGTQERKVLDVLLKADGQWVNKQWFVREMYLTQAGRAIWNLENRFNWDIIHSNFTDQYGFKSYKIEQEKQKTLL